MKCAYCGKEAHGTREHIVSCAILDLFPECFMTVDDARNTTYEADPMIKDVCADCNNNKISYIDSYAKTFIGKYFVQNYKEGDIVEVEYDYVMIQKMLLKYAYNDMRSHKKDCSFFDDEILHFLTNENDNSPKKNITVLCGLAINVSPATEAMFGNLKLRWCMNPFLYSNSTIRHINYETGAITLNDDVERENFPDLQVSYLFKFNSVQFLLMCWDKNSEKIEQNNIVLECQYPYYLMNEKTNVATIPQCTDEVNFHHFEYVHVKWDGLFEVGYMIKLASGGSYKFKEEYEKEWIKFEEELKEKHPRKK